MVCHEISGRVISHHSVGHPGRSETEIRDRGAPSLPFERVPASFSGGSPIPARAALGRDDERRGAWAWRREKEKPADCVRKVGAVILTSPSVIEIAGILFLRQI